MGRVRDKYDTGSRRTQPVSDVSAYEIMREPSPRTRRNVQRHLTLDVFAYTVYAPKVEGSLAYELWDNNELGIDAVIDAYASVMRERYDLRAIARIERHWREIDVIKRSRTEYGELQHGEDED